MKKADYIFLSIWCALFALAQVFPEWGLLLSLLAALYAVVKISLAYRIIGDYGIMTYALVLFGSNFGIISVMLLSGMRPMQISANTYWMAIAINLFAMGGTYYLMRKDLPEEKQFAPPALFALLAILSCLFQAMMA